MKILNGSCKKGSVQGHRSQTQGLFMTSHYHQPPVFTALIYNYYLLITYLLGVRHYAKNGHMYHLMLMTTLSGRYQPHFRHNKTIKSYKQLTLLARFHSEYVKSQSQNVNKVRLQNPFSFCSTIHEPGVYLSWELALVLCIIQLSLQVHVLFSLVLETFF